MNGIALWKRIAFEPDIEKAYAAHMLERLIPLGRLAHIIGGASFIGYGLWDLLLDPNALATTGPIRLAIVVFFALAFAATYTRQVRSNARIWLTIIFVTYVVVAIGFTLVLARLPGGFVAGVSGLILGLIFVPVLVLNLAQAVVISLTLVILPLIVMAATGATPFAMINAAAWVGGGAGFAIGFAYLLDNINRRAFHLERLLESEKQRSEALLLNILPASIAERLKASEETIADDCESATVLFADLVGFTELSREMPAKELVALLNDLFSRFDRLVERHGAEKIKTIGDAYMVAAGVPGSVARHSEVIANLALDMRDEFAEFRRAHGLDLKLRIGVHSGALVAGVIGERKFAYDLWGDTVNIASRMESQGLPDEIQISEETRALLPEAYRAESRGEIALKGHSPKRAFLLQTRDAVDNLSAEAP